MLAGQAHVPRQHANACPAADRQAAIPRPQTAARKIDPRQMPSWVDDADRRFDDGAHVFAEPDRQIDPRQRVGQGAVGQYPAVFHDDQMIGQPGHFFRRVADVERRYFQLVVQALQIRQDFLFAFQIQRRQRLVQEQQARIDGQLSGDADPVSFAAGQSFRLAFEQVADAESAGLAFLKAATISFMANLRSAAAATVTFSAWADRDSSRVPVRNSDLKIFMRSFFGMRASRSL